MTAPETDAGPGAAAVPAEVPAAGGSGNPPAETEYPRRATLANSFKWRLLEKGVEQNVVEELTRALVLQLTTGRPGAPLEDAPVVMSKRRTHEAVQALLVQGDEHVKREAFEQVIHCYQQALSADPYNALVRDVLGVILCRLGRYKEGGEQFRQAIKLKKSFAEAHFHLGSLFRAEGFTIQSEQPLRRALKLKPTLIEAQVGLGTTLSMLGEMSEAKSCFEKALRGRSASRRRADGVGTTERAGRTLRGSGDLV